MLCDYVNKTVFRITTPKMVFFALSANFMFFIVVNSWKLELFLTERRGRNFSSYGAALRLAPPLVTVHIGRNAE
jgi:hypothetical protein